MIDESMDEPAALRASQADVFIVGPARSGTSWLQTMLAEHPDFGSPSEIGLFVEFVGPAERAWQGHLDQLQAAIASGDTMNVQGLATVLTDDDMLAWYRWLYDRVRARVLAAKPGATRLLEKTPDHAMYVRLIERVVPDVLIIFLVRDPRDTVRSLLQAHSQPWGHWAPAAVEGATDRWLRNVRAVLDRLDHENVITIRYEDLRGGEAELCRLAKFLGIEEPSTWMRSPPDASPAERRSTIVAGEAAALGLASYDLTGFSFHDRTQQRELTPYELAFVEERCAREMRVLGYEPRGTRPPVAFGLRRRVRYAFLRGRHYWRRYARSRTTR